MDEENQDNNAGTQDNAGQQDGGQGADAGEEKFTANNPFEGFVNTSDGGDDKALEDIDPEERDTINKVVQSQLGGFSDSLQQLQQAQALSDLYTGEFGDIYKGYDADIKKALSDPRAKGLPVQIIADRIVPKGEFLRAGAERARMADKKARMSRVGGRSAGGNKGGDSIFTSATTKEGRQALADKITRGEVKIFDSED